jgi:hypothetical protein
VLGEFGVDLGPRGGFLESNLTDEAVLDAVEQGGPAPVVIAKDQIKTRVVSPNSLMPEGLLNGMEEPDVRSLFLYLRQTSEPK